MSKSIITRALFVIAFTLFMAALISGTPKRVVAPKWEAEPARLVASPPTPSHHPSIAEDRCKPAPYRNGKKLLGVRMVALAAEDEHLFTDRGICPLDRSTGLMVIGPVPVYEGDEGYEDYEN